MTDRKQPGFTLIELMLSMAFIAFLILFSVGAIWQIMRLYAKGSSISHINQSGREVVDHVSRSMRYAAPATGNQRLCVNGVSYVWNISGASTVNKFTNPNDGTLKLVTLDDPAGRWCRGNNDIPRKDARDVLSPELNIYGLSVKSIGNSLGLWDISLTIGTSGDNAPRMIDGRLQCDPNNQFCAFGNFDTSVYSKGG